MAKNKTRKKVYTRPSLSCRIKTTVRHNASEFALRIGDFFTPRTGARGLDHELFECVDTSGSVVFGRRSILMPRGGDVFQLCKTGCKQAYRRVDVVPVLAEPVYETVQLKSGTPIRPTLGTERAVCVASIRESHEAARLHKNDHTAAYYNDHPEQVVITSGCGRCFDCYVAHGRPCHNR